MSISPVISDRELLERFREQHPNLHSLQDIVELTESEFIAQFAQEFDGAERQARRVYKTAVRLREKAILVWMNLRDILSPYYQQTLFNNLPTELPECFLSQQEQIPGYERLFESLDFIECDHARSILGPAAYFVDLLRFVKRHISSQTDGNEAHANCQLNSRRPDLERIRLDAENTSALIPYIELVIEILEAFLQTSDAPEEQTADDSEADPYEVLRTAIFPVELPFHRPLSEIHAYLQQLKTSLYQIYQTFQLPLETNARSYSSLSTQAFFEISPETFQLIIQTLGANIAAHYGDTPLSGRQGLESVEVLLAQTQLTRAQLNELLYQDLDRDEVNAGLSRLFFINNVEDGLGYLSIETDESDPGNPYEKLVNLSPAKLDRLYRFIKLAQQWDGSLSELDRALRSLTSPYIPERSLSFDGINDAVAVRQFDQLQSAFTLEAWIYPSQIGKQVILSKGDEAASQIHTAIWIHSSKQLVFSIRLASGEIEEIISNRAITTHAFTHVAITVDNSAVSLYLNGQLDNQQTLAAAPESVGSDLYIGRDLIGDEAFTGLIKEVRIWNTVLNQTQIDRDRYQRFTGKERFLVGYWPLVETDTGRLDDLTPNQNHGTLGGEQLVTEPRWVNRDLVLAPLPRVGNGNGFEFNGIDQYLAGTGLTYTASGGLTLEANVRLAATQAPQSWPILFVGDRLVPEVKFGLWVNSERKLVCQFGETQHVRSSALPLQTLTHVAVVLRGTTLTFYINAVAETAIELTEAPTLQLEEENLLLGRNLGSDYFAGALQEVRIWIGDRTPEQLDRFRYRSVPANASGLIGYWPLDQIENGQAPDRSIGGHSLYLGGLSEDYFPTPGEIAPIRPAQPIASLEVEGTVLEFVGENDVITITNPNNDGLGRFERLTLEFWFRPAETNLRSDRHQILLSQGDGEAGITVYLLGQRLYVLAWCADYDDVRTPERIQRPVLVASTTVLASDKWYHLAVVNDESISLDAIAFAAYLSHSGDIEPLTLESTTWPDEIAGLGTGFQLSPVGALYLGGIGHVGFARFHDLLVLDSRNQHSYYFAGQMADLRLWQQAKTQDEILQQQELAPAASDLDLVAHLPMNEGIGATALLDTTDSGYKGVLREENIALATTGLVSDSTTATYSHFHPADIDVLAWNNYRYTGRFNAAEASGGLGVTVLSRYPAGVDQHYRLQLTWTDTPRFELIAHPLEVQSFSDIVIDGLPTPEPSRWYRFQIDVETASQETILQAKVWPDGTAEPDDYQIIARDRSDIRIQAGTVGLWSQVPASTQWFDDLRVLTLSAASPSDILLETAFEAYEAGQNPEHWVDQATQSVDGDFELLSVIGAEDTAPRVLGTRSSLTPLQTHYVIPGSSDWQDYVFTGSLRLSDLTGAVGVNILSRYPDGVEQSYSLRRDATNTAFYLVAQPEQVQPLVAAPNSQLTSNVVPAVDTWYRFTIEVTNNIDENRTEIRAKVWPAEEIEPPEFQMVGHDASDVRILTGTVGLWASGPGEKYYDRLSVRQLVLLSEDFESYTSPADASGPTTIDIPNWRSTGAGNSQDEVADLFAVETVDNNQVFAMGGPGSLPIRPNTLNYHSHYGDSESLQWTNYQYKGRMMFSGPEDHYGIGVTFFSRYLEGKDSYYRLRTTRNQGRGSGYFQLSAHPVSEEPRRRIQGNLEFRGLQPESDVWYRFLVEVEDTPQETRIRAKVWIDGTPEPDEFQMTGRDNQQTTRNDRRARLRSGGVGVWTARDGIKYFDDFEVQQIESLLPDSSAWQEIHPPSRFSVDDSYFQTALIPNIPRWHTIRDYPLLLAPLNTVALDFSRRWVGNTPHLSTENLQGVNPDAFTLEVWVRPAQLETASILSWETGSETVRLGLNAQGQPALESTGENLAGDTPLPIDSFTHLAISVSRANVSLLVNGELIAAATLGDLAPVRLDVGGPSISLVGQIADIRLWNIALDSTAIGVAQRYQQPNRLNSELVSYWPLGDESLQSDRALDTVGENPLFLGGLAEARWPIPVDLDPADRSFLRSHRRALASGPVVTGNPDAQPGILQRRTVEVWFWSNDIHIDSRKQVIYYEGDRDRGLSLYLYQGALYYWAYDTASGWTGSAIGTALVASQRWYHVALVLDGRAEQRQQSLRAYLNGKLVDVANGMQLANHIAAFSLGGTDRPVWFHDGADPGLNGHRLDGQILDLRLWNTVRAAEQLQQYRFAQPAEPAGAELIATPNFLLWWQFGEEGEPLDTNNQPLPITLEQLAPIQRLPLYALPSSDLNASSLAELVDIQQLKQRHRLSMEALSALWHPINHIGRADGQVLFDQIFNPSTGTLPPWPHHFDQPLLWDKAGNSETDRAIRARLRGALRLSDAHLNLLVERLSGAQQQKIEIDIDYLNQLHRLSRLAAVLRLNIPDFLSLLQLEQLSEIAGLVDVVTMSDRAEWLQLTGLTVADLTTLTHDPTDTENLPAGLAIDGRTLLTQVWDAAQDFLVAPDAFEADLVSEAESQESFVYLQETGTINRAGAVTAAYSERTDLSNLLERLANRHSWHTAFDVVRAEFDQIQNGRGDRAIEQLVAAGLLAPGVDGDTNGRVLAETADITESALQQIIFNNNLPNQKRESAQNALTRMTEVLLERRAIQDELLHPRGPIHSTLARAKEDQRNAVISGLAESFAASPEVTAVVFDHLLSATGITPAGFLETAQTAAEDPAELPDLLISYLLRFGKLIYLSLTFDLTVQELTTLLTTPSVFSVGDPLRPTLDELDNLYRYRRLQLTFDADQTGQLISLLKLPDTTEATERFEAVTQLTDWDARQLQALLDYFTTEAYHDVQSLSRLAACFDLAAATGLGLSSLIQLALADTVEPDDSFSFYRQQAANVLEGLRSQHTEDDWPEIYQPIRDQLSIKQRDALLALAMLRLDDDYAGRRGADVLYEFFLVDVQVSSEVLTSRIVQANASLQLYVQRCLMNLESGVDPAGIPTDEWEWVKNYRVWEANRKVFLYPENYIEPELRDTKTPLFEELEQELAQAEITDDAVAKVYTRYLDKFRELANIKVVGSYYHSELQRNSANNQLEPDPDSDDVLYLVGRTNSQPGIYYYRQQILKKTGAPQWLPWQHIDLSINAEHVTPVIGFNRLFLFWPEFTQSTRSEELLISNPNAAGLYRNYLVALALRSLLGDRFEAAENALRSAISGSLTEEQIDNIISDNNRRWGIDSQNYVYNLTTDVRISVNIDIYKPVIKYSYYNFNQAWITPQTYIEVDRELRDLEHLRPEWQRVYAQRSVELPAPAQPPTPQQETQAQVLTVDTDTQLIVDAPDVSTSRLTWGLWVNCSLIAPPLSAHEEDGISQTDVELLNYDQGSFQVLVRNRVTPIPIKTQLETGVAQAKALVESATAAIALAQTALNSTAETKAANDQAAQNQASVLQTAANDVRTTALTLPSNDPIRIQLDIAAGRAETMVSSIRSMIAAALGSQEAQDLFSAANQASSELGTSADTAESNLTQRHLYESIEMGLRLRLSGQETPEVIFLMGSWQHITVAMTYGVNSASNQDGYIFAVYLNGNATAFTSGSTESFLPSASLRLEEKLEIGRVAPDTGNQLYRTLISDVVLWDRLLDATSGEINELRVRRKTVWEAALYLPLNSVITGSRMQLVSSGNPGLTFALPASDVVNFPEPQSERIIVFYGDSVRTLRRTLLDERQFDITLSRQTSGQPNYDLDLSPSLLHVAVSNGLSLNDYAADGESTLNRFTPAALQFWIDYFDRGASAFRFTFIQAYYEQYRRYLQEYERRSREAFNQANYLLREVSSSVGSLADVGNRPGWYILDTGNEQFIIRATANTSTIEARLQLSYGNRSTDLSRQPVSVSFSNDAALTTRSNSVNQPESPEFKFEFERISTYAIYSLSETLFKEGLDGLLSLRSQHTPEQPFSGYSANSRLVDLSQTPSADIDFNGANGLYYQEIFFHIPFFLANQLNSSQQFAEAQKWYHYIFNPTTPANEGGDPRNRYWRYRPFRTPEGQTLEELLAEIFSDRTSSAALQAFRQDPFDPHALAALRLNAYPKAIVMKYIDNLLDWGDSLFSQDTRESINEAMVLYILAFNLLGNRPQGKPVRDFREIGTYADFSEVNNQNSEFLTEFERRLETSDTDLALSRHGSLVTSFCVPENATFIGYWDRVEDRLFKIRHSLNIQGVFRQLPLFQPPIDPAALVRAVASGGGVSSAISALNVAVPHYRYGFILDKAKELLGTAISLGSDLLGAIENRDSERLSVLENTHERVLLNLTTKIKELTQEQATDSIAALRANQTNIQNKRDRYDRLVNDGLSFGEAAELTLSAVAQAAKTAGVASKIIAGIFTVIPDVSSGGAGISSPLFIATTGGSKIADNADFAAEALELLAEGLQISADLSGKLGEYARREEEWEFERDTADHELEEIKFQISEAQIALDMANRDLAIHKKTQEQNQEIATFYRRKFTSEELYNWMISRLSGLYFQTFRLAYDMAKSAEKGLQFELPSTDTFITPTHWDSLRKGLLAGESLQLELQRMESFQISQDSRFQEIEKTISMRQTFPAAWLLLSMSGACEFQLGEELFDRDFPGHYFRVLKTIELTVSTPNPLPAYESVNATLSQLNSKTLLGPDIAGVQYLMGDDSAQPPDSSTLRVNWRANQQIAVSKANTRDVGMFVLDFFRDDRYFPFEGTGAVSSWRLEIPKLTNPALVTRENQVETLDIEDVLIHIRYTAAYDRGQFKTDVERLLR
ncbi:MAG: LamG-like jellyroll fold domain-containing protein [Leptolyngbyaceae cyanobacterium]